MVPQINQLRFSLYVGFNCKKCYISCVPLTTTIVYEKHLIKVFSFCGRCLKPQSHEASSYIVHILITLAAKICSYCIKLTEFTKCICFFVQKCFYFFYQMQMFLLVKFCLKISTSAYFGINNFIWLLQKNIYVGKSNILVLVESLFLIIYIIWTSFKLKILRD